MIYLSIKCKNGSMPAILNHTPRSAKCFQQGGDLDDCVELLDQIIKKMNIMRYDGDVGEDIHISKINMTAEEKMCLFKVIAYFIFVGSGSRKAKHACNSVLEVLDPCNPLNWKFHMCETMEEKLNYIELIYDKLILSMRDKGMPSSHLKVCEPWIYYQDENNKEKGSLHIRMKK